MPTETIQPSVWRQRDVIFTGKLSEADARAVQRAYAAGELKQIREGMYTPYEESEWPGVMGRNRNAVLAALFPGAVLGWHSAFAGGSPIDGVIFLTDTYSRNVELPGLKVVLIKGAGHQPGDLPWQDGTLHFSGEARGFLENLAIARSKPRRAAGPEEVRKRLQLLLQHQGESKLNTLRDQARQLAPTLGLERESKLLDDMITALLSTHPAATRAGAHGLPFDSARLELFEAFASALRARSLPVVASVADHGSALTHFAFLESYFSNFIEGTRFVLEEAIAIAIEGKVPQARPKDAHDILGVMAAAANPNMLAAPLPVGQGSIAYMKSLHGTVMKDRPDVRPGEFKTVNNAAGNTVFVHKDLVQGTLVSGSKILTSVPEGLPRALLAMFIIAEIHPFDDGNGRIARLVMNAELSRCGVSRIIIPTLMREDYLDCLRVLTRSAEVAPFVKIMVTLQAWTAKLPYANLDELVAAVHASNALEENRTQFRLLDRDPQ